MAYLTEHRTQIDEQQSIDEEATVRRVEEWTEFASKAETDAVYSSSARDYDGYAQRVRGRKP